MTHCQSCALTDVGLLRTNNEDTIFSNPELGLWLVADGMGGHEAGEVASAITQRTIARTIKSGATLEQAILDAHNRILRAADSGEGKHGMGSTVVALQANERSYHVAWVGDSRGYLYSPSKAPKLIRLTKDHSYVQTLFDSGVISQEEMDHHPDKNIITQCLGSTELVDIKVDSVADTWKPGERLVLCSDGLSDSVSEETIVKLLSNNTSVESAAKALMHAALASGGKDNISIVVVDAPVSLKPTLWGRLRDCFKRPE